MNSQAIVALYRAGLMDGTSGELGAFIPPNLHHLRIQEAARLIIPQCPSSVLDVGCGVGMLATELEGVFPYHGIDLVPELIDIARLKVSHSACSFSVGGIDSVVGQHDMVVCLGVMSHVADADSFVASLCSLARLHVLIEAHDPAVYYGKFAAHSPGSIASAFSKFGFAVIHCDSGTATDSSFRILGVRV